MIELDQQEIAFVSGGATAKEILKETILALKNYAWIVAVLGIGVVIGFETGCRATKPNFLTKVATLFNQVK